MGAPRNSVAERPSDFIRALVCGYSRASRDSRRLLMLRAFIDDSDIGRHPVYVLAGWIAPVEAWAKFSDEWAAVLAMRPRIDYFKYSEAMNFSGEFNGICEASRNEKMAILYNLIEEYKLNGVSAIIDHSVFKRTLARSGHKLAKNPYFMIFYLMARNILEYCKNKGGDEKIDMVFDYQPGQVGIVLQAWEFFVRTAPAEYSRFFNNPPIFQDDKKTVALQAADFVAGWLRANEAKRIANKAMPNPPWRKSPGNCLLTRTELTEEAAKEMLGFIINVVPFKLTGTFGYGYPSGADS